MSNKISKKKIKDAPRRQSIMDVSSKEPSLETYGTVGPSFRRLYGTDHTYDSQYTNRKNSLTGRRDSLSDRRDSLTDHKDSSRKSSLSSRKGSFTNGMDSIASRKYTLSSRKQSLPDRRDSLSDRRDSFTYRKDSIDDETVSLGESDITSTGADSGITEDYLVPRYIPRKETLTEGFMAIRKEQKKRKKNKDGMKPREKERLAKNRGMIVRTIDVALIMEDMRKGDFIDHKDEAFIMDDPRRRQRAARFLDILECKKTSAYAAFLDVIGDLYPQIYLQLVDWEGDEADVYTGYKAEDEWSQVRRMRRLLIDDLDATQILPFLQEKHVLTSREVSELMKIGAIKKRTEAFLDVIETKSVNAHELFLESISELFPHLYLMLTERGDEDDEFDALYG